MILNPLRKEDNTEALVKALEDANGTAGTADDSQAADPIRAADPTMQTPAPDTPISDQPAPEAPVETAPQPEPVADNAADNPAANGISFDGNDLPAGLSSDADAHVDAPAATGDDGELDGVKRSALEQLRPLIEKLDLEPADKFDKYLMMLRASDDPALIKPAFDAAQGIAGEKEKAQALLDIINEINYITASKQQQNPPTPAAA